nr:Chain B, Rabaptin-5 [synthetic construct]
DESDFGPLVGADS